MKPLSELLSEMSARAKGTEDHVSEAQKEAHDKIVARREQTRAAVEDAINKVNEDLNSMGDTAGDKWRSLQTKIRSDMDALKAGIAQRMHERDVSRADKHADRLEWRLLSPSTMRWPRSTRRSSPFTTPSSAALKQNRPEAPKGSLLAGRMGEAD